MSGVASSVSSVSRLSGLLLRYAHFAPELSKSLPFFSKTAIIEQDGANLLNNAGF